MEATIPDYNTAITALRKQEYSTLGLLYRFWDQEDVNRFEMVMETVKKIDVQVHSLNTETIAVVSGKKEKADTVVTRPVTKRLEVLNGELKGRVTVFLAKLI